MLIDDDAILEPDYLENVFANLADGVLAYSGSVYVNGMLDVGHRRRLKDRTCIIEESVPKEEYEDKSFEYDIATFCGFVISKEIIKKIGLPKAEYFIWYDDYEYFLRMAWHTKILNINVARLNHKVGKLEGNKLSWKDFYGFRNHWDGGRLYSDNVMLFNIRQYWYHITRAAGCVVYAFRYHDEKVYYRNRMRLHLDVVRAARKRKFGYNEHYYQGRDLTKP